MPTTVAAPDQRPSGRPTMQVKMAVNVAGCRKIVLRPTLALMAALLLAQWLAPPPLAPLATAYAANAAKKQKSATPATILKQIATLPAGKDRDAAVDELLEFGEPAWAEVKVALPSLAAIEGGANVVVDLLLGFGPAALDEIVAWGPKLADGPALRLCRQVLRFPKDDRQAALLEALLPRNDEQILLLILPELVTRDRPAAMARLVVLIDDTRPGVRNYAIDTLVAKRWEPAMTPLVRRLGQERLSASPENLGLRSKIIHAIAQIGADREAPVPPLFEALELPDQREAVLEGLQTVGAPAIKAAIYLLQTAERSRIETALVVLSHLRVAAAPQLVPVLVNTKDEMTRTLIVDMLAHLAVPEVRAEVLRMVRERKFPDLEQGLLLALTLYDDDVRKLLLEMLVAPDMLVRALAIKHLWRLADPETWPALRNVAARDADVGLRLQALHAMVGLGDPKAADYLRKLVTVNELDERLEVIRLIGRVDDMSAIPVLAHQLADPNDAVFRAALASLKRLSFHSGPRREVEWLGWLAAENARKPEDFETVQPRGHRFTVDGREMGWLEAGSPDDKTIVVLAAGPLRDASHLVPTVWRLAKSYHVVVPLRGVSAHTAATLSEQVLAQELSKLQQELGKPQIALLADPSASHFALRYANEHPKAIAAVLLHGGLWPSQAAVRAVPGQVAAAMQSPWKEDMAWALEQKGLLVPDLALRQLSRAVYGTVLANPEIARLLPQPSYFYDGFSVEAHDRAVADAGAWDPSKAMVPMLILAGQKAPWAEMSTAAIQGLPASVRKQIKLVKLDASGAMPLAEQPDDAVRAIEDFLK